ncbi:hypothetical protein F4815DRAFT_393999 [Daldinia loculata]|nr:hypothetical protein F4815DRAFT_393999 [Daldinia loculata]
MASNTPYIPLNEPCIMIRMCMLYGDVFLGCPWCSSKWIKRPGDLKNHLSSVHDGMLREAGINLTLQTNTSTAISPLPGNPTSFQPGNMGAIPSHNPSNPIPVHGSSQTSGFSSRTRQSGPTPVPPSLPSSRPPSRGVRKRSRPPNITFQPNNRATSTVNGGIAPSFMPPPPSNNHQGNASTQDLFDFDQFLSDFQMEYLE